MGIGQVTPLYPAIGAVLIAYESLLRHARPN
jgi:hypothetical protein